MLPFISILVACIGVLLRHADAQTAATTPAPVTIGGPGPDIAYAIATHPTEPGTVFLTGTFAGTANFPTSSTGSISLTATEGTPGDAFVARLDADGFYAWAVVLALGEDPSPQRPDSHTRGLDIAVNGAGTHVYVVGDYRSSDITASGRDGFLVQMDADNGVVVWDRRARGEGDALVAIVAVATDDTHGGVVVAGHFGSATVQFGSTQTSEGSTHTLDNFGGTAADRGMDIFLAYYHEGMIQWVPRIGGSSDQILGLHNGGSSSGSHLIEGPGKPLTIDADGNTYLVGSFLSCELFFETSTALEYTLCAEDRFDGFALKVDITGTLQWSEHLGDWWGGASGAMQGHDYATAVALDGSGGVYVSGSFETQTFRVGGSGAGSLGVSYAGEGEPFVAKLAAADGAPQWLTQLGGKQVCLYMHACMDVWMCVARMSASITTNTALTDSLTHQHWNHRTTASSGWWWIHPSAPCTSPASSATSSPPCPAPLSTRWGGASS